MSFFAVLFALVIEQLKPLPRDNWVHHALVSWVSWTGRNFDAGRPHHAWVVWCVSVLAPGLVISGAYLALNYYSAVLALVFDVTVLYLTLGLAEASTQRRRTAARAVRRGTREYQDISARRTIRARARQTPDRS
jgi:adenosylcobinamide-phosphate synthase